MLANYKKKQNFLRFISLIGILVVLVLFYYLSGNSKSILQHENLLNNYMKNVTNSKQNYEIMIENSLFKGLSKEQEPYEIHSKYAYKTTDNKYKLDQIDANYKLLKQNLFIFAKEGLIDEQKKQIYLKNKIELNFEDLIIYGNEINLDLISKDINSRSKVKLKYKNSIIDADSFNAIDNNQKINFKGHVKTKIHLTDF